jgi:hypothetical protein
VMRPETQKLRSILGSSWLFLGTEGPAATVAIVCLCEGNSLHIWWSHLFGFLLLSNRFHPRDLATTHLCLSICPSIYPYHLSIDPSIYLLSITYLCTDVRMHVCSCGCIKFSTLDLLVSKGPVLTSPLWLQVTSDIFPVTSCIAGNCFHYSLSAHLVHSSS